MTRWPDGPHEQRPCQSLQASAQPHEALVTAILSLLDTNIVSYFLRRSSPMLEARLAEALKAQSVAISVLTRGELRYGQSAMAADDRRRGLIDQFLRQLPCLPWTEQAADHYGGIKHELRRLGSPIGELDTQIAAHAMAEGLVLVTHNVRHFERVSGLVVEDWMV